MFAEYLYDMAQARYEKRIILIDEDQILEKVDWQEVFIVNGCQPIEYENDLKFRIDYEDIWKAGQDNYVFMVKTEDYVPYDIRKPAHEFHVSYQKLFPKLNGMTLKEASDLNLDLLTLAFLKNYDDLRSEERTKKFLSDRVYGKENIREYLEEGVKELSNEIKSCNRYADWMKLAEKQARLQVMAAEYGLKIDTTFVDQPFQNFVLKDYGKLSSEISRTSPVLVSRAMDFMHELSRKFALIVMDGMSLFDWRIVRRSFADLKFCETEAFAMVPTITSISRQCLVSGKYPKDLLNPWSTSKEKNEFIAGAEKLGFTDAQIAYGRGYDTDFSMNVQCACIIVNDVDDMMHGQKQGRFGMYQDVALLTQKHQLHDTVKRLLGQGFDVYISADHGNTECIGTGKFMKAGVETETKSHRMIVLKDFADKDALIQSRNMVEYPGYFLDKKFDYLICSGHESMDAKGEQVITHGGMTLEEVVVPFIAIKADENHG